MPDHARDDLDARLRDLAAAPTAPLPGAAAARARGAARTRRARALLAGTGAVTAVLVVTAVAALSGSGGSDRDTLPFATAAPTPTVVLEEDLRPLLLDEGDVASAAGGSWSEVTTRDTSAEPPTCTDPYPDDLRELTSGERWFTDGTGRTLTHLVRVFPDSGGAAAAWGLLVDAVEACPSPPELPGSSVEVLGGLPGTGPDQAYVRVRADVRTQAYVLIAEGRVLSVVQLAGTTADVDQLPILADLARARAGGTQPGSPDPWQPADALLPPEQADAAEQPGWRVGAPLDADDLPLADPCGERSAPQAEAVVEVVGRAMGSSREHGGSSLAQEVYRYASATTAADAFSTYWDRFRRCAQIPDPHDEEMTVRFEVVEAAEQRRLLVRRLPCMAPEVCADHFSTYVLVVRVEDALTSVEYALAEDGDPAQEARDLMTAVERRLRETVLR